MIQDGLKTLLLADATFAGLLGSRLYAVAFPRGNFVYPICVYHTFSPSDDYDNAGPTANKELSIQLDYYAPDYTTARNCANAGSAVLMPYTGTLNDGTVVKLITRTQDMDMPYVPSADVKGTTFRAMTQYRIVFNDPQ